MGVNILYSVFQYKYQFICFELGHIFIFNILSLKIQVSIENNTNFMTDDIFIFNELRCF